jgi:hypothetical protein
LAGWLQPLFGAAVGTNRHSQRQLSRLQPPHQKTVESFLGFFSRFFIHLDLTIKNMPASKLLAGK